jgi:murein DD-endopeptidase MepM/ murein hydrolase activator NlpD
MWSGGFVINAFATSELRAFSWTGAGAYQPPAFLIPIYKEAGRRYGIAWQILAAINAIETDYGRNLATSPKGAIGWMQFMPETWRKYGAPGAGTSSGNPFDPRAAIFAAARMLAANGGRTDIRAALFAYNHATWYVDEVVWLAGQIKSRVDGDASGDTGYELPLDARYMNQLGRTDDGVDIESAPDGATVFSITPGVVTAVASDPGGFGPDYPVVLVTAGPLAGRHIYYGHVAASLVHVGQQLAPGEPVAVIGHTGDAAGLGHGHLEIGFSDGSGDPLDHHGAEAWTPAGQAMRQVLVTLSGAG